MRTTARVLALVAALWPIASAAPAGAAVPVAVRANAVNERLPTANEDWLAWSQNSKRHPKNYDVRAARIGGAHSFQVNSPASEGYTGGVDQSTDVLAYAQVRRDEWDIKLFDLGAKERSNPPAGVNTKAREYLPTISGDELLFTRYKGGTETYQVVLWNLDDGSHKVLLSGTKFAAAGQVNGDYATWNTCGNVCNSFRYAISTGLTKMVPNPSDKDQFGPSVTPAGTVFFVQAGAGGGVAWKIKRFTLAGAVDAPVLLPVGFSVGTTFAFRAAAETRVYFDRKKRPTNDWNLYEFTVGAA